MTRADLLPAGALYRLGSGVHIHETVDSTNALLLERAAELDDGAIACAEFQRAGRGRLGRRWVAPRGSSVILSVLLREPVDSPLLPLSGLLGALSACEAIEAATDCAPAVRWPNDVVIHDRKVGGVLAESCPLSSARAVVIGIGINCLQQRGHFDAELADRATSLEVESAQPVSRAAVAAAVLARLDHWLLVGARERTGWAELRSAWRACCGDVGTRVTLEHDGRVHTGTALDISAAGDLVVQLDQGGRRQFASATTTRVW